MDIVYSLSDIVSSQLVYSLRSLQNMPHGSVFFVGGKPMWAKNIIHIPTEQYETKWKNVPRNLIEVCKDQRVSEDFIYMNDDFFILERVREPMRELNLYNGTVRETLGRIQRKTPYIEGMEQTYKLLKELGKEEPLNYELHIPCVFNKDNFLKMFEIEGVNDIEVLHYRSLYGNLYRTVGKDSLDVKITQRSGFKGKPIKFLSCSNDGFELLEQFLDHRFPNQCPYEI